MKKNKGQKMSLLDLEKELGINGYSQRYIRLDIIKILEKYPKKPFMDFLLYSKRELNPTEVELILMKLPFGLEVIHWLKLKLNTPVKTPDGKVLILQKGVFYRPLFKVIEIVETGEMIEK